jgi:tetratricopeptide (TPR) repeat protein
MTVRIVSKVARTRMACIVLLLAVLAGAAPASAQGDPVPDAVAKIAQRYDALYAASKYAEALSQARKLAALTNSRLGERHPQHVVALEKLSLAYASLGRDGRAAEIAGQAIDIARSRNWTTGSELTNALVRLANRYDSAGREHDGASAYCNLLRVKLELLKRQSRADELKIAAAASELAAAVTDDGDFAQAVELQAFALAIRERKLGANDLLVADNLRGLALLAAKQDRRDDAERFYKRVLAIQEAKLGPTHGDVADTLEELAGAIEGDRRAQAEALRERAQVIRRTDRPSFIRGPGMRPGMRPPPAMAPPPRATMPAPL